MPVARYFLYVSGVLLALLFLVNAFMPQDLAVANHSAPGLDKTAVRIHSVQKLPERVVYDTSLPTIVPPAARTVVAAAAPPAPAGDASAQTRVRNTFAQFVPAEAKKLEPPQAPKKRRIAKVRTYPPANPQMRFAQQQPHFGFFGGPIWNSTW
jgi:hypothetical protein